MPYLIVLVAIIFIVSLAVLVFAVEDDLRGELAFFRLVMAILMVENGILFAYLLDLYLKG